jgi:hypothetical protein
MDALWEYLAGRMQEPSTWVSLGTLFTAAGWAIAPEHWQLIAAIGMGIGGILGTVLRERKKTTAAEVKNVVEAVTKAEALKSKQPSDEHLDAAMKATP